MGLLKIDDFFVSKYDPDLSQKLVTFLWPGPTRREPATFNNKGTGIGQDGLEYIIASCRIGIYRSLFQLLICFLYVFKTF